MEYTQRVKQIETELKGHRQNMANIAHLVSHGAHNKTSIRSLMAASIRADYLRLWNLLDAFIDSAEQVFEEEGHED